jgi:ATP-dependent RNA helicase DBP3
VLCQVSALVCRVVPHLIPSCPRPPPPAGELINVLREANQKVPEALLAFGTTVKKKEHKLYGAHFKDVDLNAKATKMTFDSDDE